ncbi:replication protein REP [Weissella oryzae SG25]|uniref:Replication protein REP n=1 Tax=Weissella oryzae (strain DSM 25784 / JCM 18191 / LMG 30913 / SG25) TaxID=1329250 RepID=A0A069D062_WEIOS|nr:DnaD domain protein [Weissella oryzae]GAK30711.1 replication protein REP [Weissella oryzae SG25]
MRQTIKRKKSSSNFTIINNDFLRDKDLTLQAKGLLSYLMMLPDDWVIYFEEVAKNSKNGIRSTRGAWSELEAAGYAINRRITDEKGKVIRWQKEVSDSKEFLNNPHCGFPHVENPQVDNPHVENSMLLSTYIPSTDITNDLNTKDKPLLPKPEVQVANFFQSNGFGMIGGLIAEELRNEMNDFNGLTNDQQESANIIIKALSRAVENGVPTWNYAKKPLKDWYDKGIKNVAEIEVLDLQRANQKAKWSRNRGTPKVKEARPNFEEQNVAPVSSEDLAAAQQALDSLNKQFKQKEET